MIDQLWEICIIHCFVYLNIYRKKNYSTWRTSSFKIETLWLIDAKTTNIYWELEASFISSLRFHARSFIWWLAGDLKKFFFNINCCELGGSWNEKKFLFIFLINYRILFYFLILFHEIVVDSEAHAFSKKLFAENTIIYFVCR